MTCKLTVVDCDAVPDVPTTVTVDVPAAALGCVFMVKVLVQGLLDTEAGLKLQDVSCGAPEQLRLTVPLKQLCGVIVTVEVVELPAETLAGLNALAETV